MCSKILFFVATLYVVNASVITINVYDDDGQKSLASEDDYSLQSCNNQECDQRCRRLKFHGGVCVNGRCKCDNFRSAEEYLSLRSCYNQECDQRCRRLKFPGGICVNGRCKCDNFLNAEDDGQKSLASEDDYSLRSCNNQECDQRCRRLKFPGGPCVNGRCKCDNFRSAEEYLSLRSCNNQECDQRCRRLKFPGGICVNGRCKCDNFRNAEDFVTNPEKNIPTRTCYYRECNEWCQTQGFAGGVCINNRCKCEHKFAQDSIDELENSLASTSCFVIACEQRCRRMGYTGGACVNGRCECEIRRAEESVTESADSIVLNPSGSSKVRNCNPEVCNTLCRLLHYNTGTCVSGFCKCTRNEDATISSTQNPASTESPNFTTTAAAVNDEVEESNHLLNENDHIDEHHERDSRAACEQYKCNDSCIRVGYAGGLCRKGKCKCY